MGCGASVKESAAASGEAGDAPTIKTIRDDEFVDAELRYRYSVQYQRSAFRTQCAPRPEGMGRCTGTFEEMVQIAQAACDADPSAKAFQVPLDAAKAGEVGGGWHSWVLGHGWSTLRGTDSCPDRNWAHFVKEEEGCKLGGAILQRIKDARLLDSLQRCLETNPDWLGKGRDVTASENLPQNVGAYSRLQLIAAWMVINDMEENRYNLAAQQVKQDVNDLPSGLAECGLRSAGWSSRIGIVLDEKVNENIAVHGTSPEVLGAVLSSGLNERYSSGHFGAGTYLAEDAGKADQYCKVDAGSEHPTSLHRALYPGGEHPGDVCYLLICKVLLGEVAFTFDGCKQIEGAELWANADTKRELAPVPNSDPPFAYHSMLVETGAAVKRYRELVVFHADRILIKYLIAYRRQP